MRFLILWLLLLPSLMAQASGPAARFERLSSDAGLSQNSVSTILQDSQGFMWFGTYDGLNRYDGYEFKVFRHDPNNPNSVTGSNIRVLYEDSQGILWIGTDSGGLSQYHRQSQRFVHFKHDPSNPHSLSHNRVTAITEDATGTLWTGTFGGGLNRFDRQKQRFSRFNHQPDHDQNPANSLSSNHITALLTDQHDNLWIGSQNHGISQYNITNRSFRHFSHQADNPHSLSHNNIRSIFQDSQGTLWIGSKHGLNRLDGDHFVHFKHQPNNPRSLSDNSIWSIEEDAGGILWIGTEDGGLNQLTLPLLPTRASEKIATKEFKNQKVAKAAIAPGFNHFRNAPSDIHSLSQGRVKALFNDNKGTLWIGLYGGGVNYYDANKGLFGHFKHQSDDRHSLSANSVHAIFKDSRNTLWIGTDNALNKYHPQSQQFSHFKHDPNDPNSISSGRVNTIYEDSQGILWVGNNGSGLNQYDRHSQRFKHFTHQDKNPHSLSNNIVRSILEDSRGTLWIGTYGGGLNRYDRKTGRFEAFRHHPGESSSLSSDLVMSVIEDSQGELWVATNGGGLNHFDGQNDEFGQYRQDSNSPQSLSDDRAWYIHQDQQQDLWIGTASGLNHLDRNSEHFTHYQQKDGLADDVVLGILEDQQGQLWVSSNKGLSTINPLTKAITRYDINDGLQSNEFNQGAYFAASNGELFFGGINGFNRFYPQQIGDDNNLQTNMVLTDFLLFNQSVTIGAQNALTGDSTRVLTKAINALDQLTLSHEETLISFEFAALNLSNPMHAQYAYQLQGWDKEWIQTDAKRRFATYTRLSPGNYSFKVKLSTPVSQTGYPEQIKSIKITVLPAPWFSRWALSGYILLALALALLPLVTVLMNRRNRHNQQSRHSRHQPRLDNKPGGTPPVFNQNERPTAASANHTNNTNNTIADTIHHNSQFRILMVDDEPINLQVLHNHLSLLNYQLVEAIDGEQALRFIDDSIDHSIDNSIDNNGPFDLVLLDIMMPGLSGFEVCQKLREKHSVNDLPILFLTAKNQEEDLVEGFAVGGNDYLTKPITKSELLARVETHLKLLDINRHLEHKVAQRTTELAQKNREVMTTQQQLLQAEKMASLGTLTAGVAHEINNPTNFVHISAFNLEQDLNRFQQFLFELAGAQAQQAVLDSFREQFKPLHDHLQTIKNGTERIKAIVDDLRAYTQLSSSDLQSSDITGLLRSTVHLVQTQYLELAEFITDFKITNQIQCYPGQLNQVFMNLIVNACDAIRDKQRQNNKQGNQQQPSQRGKIEVSCKMVNAMVEVCIKDNGCGMTPETLNKLFEPFYTTKDIGEGSGLGLSISYGIVQQHQGELTVESKLGLGSTFRLRLPLQLGAVSQTS
ncbi:MAG: ligand-binding sensor domain-containing protein/signal transduction histidine kinase [Phenylobacterium sp.]|jgi:ligand-binding sensor domain-containing protein/signal transduction histidine kinase